MESTRTRPRGFALPIAVFALGIIGVLVTGGFFLARQETRVGVAARQSSTAFYLAELGVSNTLDAWDAPTYSGIATGDSIMRSDTVAVGTADVTVTRLSDWLFFVDSESTVTRGG
ncbi:MAG: hypothetical protein KJP18_12285, partial [Gemmatimonadetes bacterium]|nr:hypothetical protein [Gemmatimonadota bacterium]